MEIINKLTNFEEIQQEKANDMDIDIDEIQYQKHELILMDKKALCDYCRSCKKKSNTIYVFGLQKTTS